MQLVCLENTTFYQQNLRISIGNSKHVKIIIGLFILCKLNKLPWWKNIKHKKLKIKLNW